MGAEGRCQPPANQHYTLVTSGRAAGRGGVDSAPTPVVRGRLRVGLGAVGIRERARCAVVTVTTVVASQSTEHGVYSGGWNIE